MRQIKWQEPASFIRASKRRTNTGCNARRQMIVFLAVAGALVLLFGGAAVIGYYRHGFKQESGLSWWAFPAITVGVAFVIAYVIPWIISLTNATIAVSTKGVYRTSRERLGYVFRHWPWETIRSCRLSSITLDETTYQMLMLSLQNGETVSIGLSEKVDVDELKELLRRVGKIG